MSSITVPIKVIKGDLWLSFMHITSKAKIRAIGMDKKPKRVQDTGNHHCFEIDVEGNIRIRLKSWKVNV